MTTKMKSDKYDSYLKALKSNKNLSSVVNGSFTSKKEKITEEKRVFRFLPMEDGEPFKPVFKHYIDKKEYICPNKNRELLGDKVTSNKCPICTFASKLYNDSQIELKGRKPNKISDVEKANSPKLAEACELFEMFKDYMPKTSIYSNVIVRGQEDEGAKILWLTPKAFEQILTIREDQIDEEESKDITDIVVGSDFKIFKVQGKKPMAEINVLHAGIKPLTSSVEVQKKVLESVVSDPFNYELPTTADLEKVVASKFRFTDSEAEAMSSETSVGSSTSDEEDDLAKLMNDM